MRLQSTSPLQFDEWLLRAVPNSLLSSSGELGGGGDARRTDFWWSVWLCVGPICRLSASLRERRVLDCSTRHWRNPPTATWIAGTFADLCGMRPANSHRRSIENSRGNTLMHLCCEWLERPSPAILLRGVLRSALVVSVGGEAHLSVGDSEQALLSRSRR